MKRLVAVSVALLLGGLVFAADPSSPILKRIVDREELRVGMSGTQPPFVMKNKEGKLVGFEVDMARELAAAMGVKLTIITKPFDELLPAVTRGEVDMVMSGMTMTPKRSLKYAFVGPYYVSGKSLLTKSKNLAETEDTSRFDKEGMKLVALKGSTSEEYITNVLSSAELIVAEDYDAAVKMVIDRRAHAMVADLPACVVTMLRHPNQGLMTSAALLTTEPIGIAIQPGDPLAVSFIGNLVSALETTGKTEAFAKKWFQGASWLSSMP